MTYGTRRFNAAFTSLLSYNFHEYHLSRSQGFIVSMATYGSMDTIEGPFWTFGQQGAAAFSEHTGQNTIQG
jgi:hypothetical protein